ncbi:MAG TPA: membrane-bound lytic murein transglycosylase MltF, partial [Thiotrichales bacterium]|nr:membrane-bound lytic murein transglycosylase MltF [Thiotrichales bacterium]
MIAGIIFTFKVLPRLSAETLLDEIKTNGQLVVITRNSPVSYYEDVDGPAGLDYELAQMFADRLGVELALVVPETFHEVLDELAAGEAHIAAAGLTVTPAREKRFHFGPPYQEVSQQLVYNVAQRRPKNLSSLDGLLEVVADSSHAERLHYLQKVIPTLSWKENDELDSAELLQLVAEGIVDYTIVDSNEFTLNQRYLLNLRVAFDISEPEPLAWALKKSEDKSLLLEVQKFFREIRDNGELTRLIERNYGHVDEFDYVGTKIFRRHIAKRLPAYEEMFRQAAEKYNLDWRLLAAIGYQESHWDPKAVSPTGVRGIMMLTRKTAKSLGVNNRLDPASSIEGGARYYSQMLEKMDPDIPEPDRSWLAMAAYNVGYYHLQDARKITRMLNKDPNRWFDVKESLPLLAQKKWHRKTRYGYARGWEPVQYVENIRSYYDI